MSASTLWQRPSPLCRRSEDAVTEAEYTSELLKEQATRRAKAVNFGSLCGQKAENNCLFSLLALTAAVSARFPVSAPRQKLLPMVAIFSLGAAVGPPFPSRNCLPC